MMSAQFHIDVVSELEKILPSCKLLVPTAVLKELSRIKNRTKGKNKIAASIAIKIATSSPIQVLEMELRKGESVDDSLLRLSEKSQLLCTNDRELRIKAREKDINVIFLRQRRYLDVDGHLNP
ncbi:PIN domain-containing protein [Methanobacterium sp.]|uniref:type II toxin-antitoxin system VapC family toxin n=2 Tax=Methanobacterium sp. TaxID=2164 RepID=UPI003C707514